MKKIMWVPILSAVLITVGVILLILGTMPMHNEINGKTLTVKYIIGQDTIDLSDAHFYPVPDEATHHIIRVAGTSLGKKQSGRFMNTQTKTIYRFYLTGKGKRKYFEIGDKKYLVDGF